MQFFPRLDGTIVSWNLGAEKIYGYAAHEMIGMPVATLAPEGYQNEMTAIMDRIRRGDKIKHFETKRRCKDGKIIDVSVTISPIVGRNGVVTGVSTVARDITAQKRRQKEHNVRQTEQLQTQAAAIMQDLGKLLGAILTHADVALAELPSDSSAREELQKLRSEAERGVEIVHTRIPSDIIVPEPMEVS